MRELLDHVLATATSVHRARQTQVNQFANISRITLLLYDIIINIDREKRLVWDAKFRASTVLYYILRYPVIAFQFFTVFLSPTLPQYVLKLPSCHTHNLILTRLTSKL
ncbi:hypothetical protein L218DRAFT_451466 [Marasmius fiardii PR-910]|nr:hypothetical protein L218DRAFT_451466 [Marasmius fiardii PR-910]